VFDCDVSACETCALDGAGNAICVAACGDGQQCTQANFDPPEYSCAPV